MPSISDHPDVSAVTFPKPAWRYVLLFQSWSQLHSWGLLVIAPLAVVIGLLGRFDPRGIPVESLLAGAVIGSLFAVIAVMPTEFVIRSSSQRLFRSLTSELEGLGYVVLESRTERKTYRQNLPRLLRWDEGNVIIDRSGGRLVVRGPLLIVKKVRRSLAGRTV